MRLIDCHIENFGKWSNQDFSFNSGLNTILENNGWGKSTLAAFIRAMFYGFVSSNKKNLEENDRVFYTPWQGGVYGGSLTFESKGKRYEITRTFGESRNGSKDTFALKDAITNLPSNDFTNEIGVELFQVDAASFARTIFIGQEDVRYSGTTSEISAKLGNLSENTNDLNNYDTADARLSDYLLKHSIKRTTGSLNKTNKQMTQLKVDISQAPQIEKRIQNLQAEKEQLAESKNEILARQEKLLDSQKILISLHEQQGLQKQLTDFAEAEESRKAKTEELRKRFGNRVPEHKEIQDKVKVNTSMQQNLAGMEHFLLSDEEKTRLKAVGAIFKENVPELTEVQELVEKAAKVGELREKSSQYRLSIEDEDELELLKERFRVGIPSDEEIDNEIQAALVIKTNQGKIDLLKKGQQDDEEAKIRVQQQMRELSQKMEKNNARIESKAAAEKERDRKYKEKVRNKQKLGIGLMIAGIVVAILGVVLRNFGPTLWIALGLTLVLEVAGIIVGFTKVQKEEDEETEDQSEFFEKARKDTEVSYAAAANELSRIEGKLLEYEANLAAENEAQSVSVAKVSNFLAMFGLEYDARTADQELYDLRRDIVRYDKLQKKKQLEMEHDENDSMNKLIEEIRATLQPYYSNFDAPVAELLHQVDIFRDDATDIRSLGEKYGKYISYQRKEVAEQKELESFLSEVVPAQQLVNIQTTEDIASALSSLAESLIKYENALKEEKVAREARSDFEKLHPGLRLRGDVESRDSKDRVDEDLINEQLKACLRELDRIRDGESAFNREIEAANDELDHIAEMKDELETMQEEYKAGENYYHLVEKTQVLLAAAKERFTTKFMKPIMDGYGKYYQMITKSGIGDFKIDANARLTMKAQGQERDIVQMSGGYQDLIGVAMRMALVDVMYEKEKPFLILDDSFDQVDDVKMPGAMEMLREISKEYQIIYFTCSESRTA